jgi:NAD(P)-dependent dehydrogenase (short-subunit alcohol dehydrogenase family)
LFKVNVIGNVHLFNLFIPLVLKGRVKKVITISSGLADIEVTSKFDLDHAAPYAISKAAMNAAVAKFSAQYAKNGVLFMSICPGAVNTGHNSSREFPVTTCGDVKSDRWIVTEEQMPKVKAIFGKFHSYAPNFTGESEPELAIKDVISVIEKSSVVAGDGGSFVSHFGNKQWLWFVFERRQTLEVT